MTHKVQYSKKFDDGSIIVIGGDTVDEFEVNYETFRASPIGKSILSKVSAVNPPAPKPNGAPEQVAPPTVSGDAERVVLPADAVMEIVHKGDNYYGEIAPFPGTKFPVKVWKEVVDTIDGLDVKAQGVVPVGEWEVDFVKNEKGYPLKVVAFV